MDPRELVLPILLRAAESGIPLPEVLEAGEGLAGIQKHLPRLIQDVSIERVAVHLQARTGRLLQPQKA